MRPGLKYLGKGKRRIYRRLRGLLPHQWQDVRIGWFTPDPALGESAFIKEHWFIRLTYENKHYRIGLGVHCPVHRFQEFADKWAEINCEGAVEAASWFIRTKLQERSFARTIFTCIPMNPVARKQQEMRDAAESSKRNAEIEKIDRERKASDARRRANHIALLTDRPYKLSAMATEAAKALRWSFTGVPKLQYR